MTNFVFKCHLCGRGVATIEGEIYCISNFILSRHEKTGGMYTRWIEEGPATKNRPYIDKVTQVEYYFHRECFEIIAGKEYLSTEIA